VLEVLPRTTVVFATFAAPLLAVRTATRAREQASAASASRRPLRGPTAIGISCENFVI
jgi:hypothetical protein